MDYAIINTYSLIILAKLNADGVVFPTNNFYIAERAMMTFMMSEVPADGPSTKESRR